MRSSNISDSVSDAWNSNGRSSAYAQDRARAAALVDDCIDISGGSCSLQDCYDWASDQGIRLGRSSIQIQWVRAHRAGRC